MLNITAQRFSGNAARGAYDTTGTPKPKPKPGTENNPPAKKQHKAGEATKLDRQA